MPSLGSCRACCALPRRREGIRKAAGCGVCLLIFGIGLLIVAATVPVYVHDLVETELVKMATIDSVNATGFEGWQDNKKNMIRMNAYVYDLVNSDEVFNGADPVFVERGPYVYWGGRKNYNISWSNGGEEISWRMWERWTFDRELSVESDEERIITWPSVVFMGLRYNAVQLDIGKDYLLLMYQGLLEWDEKQTFFSTQSVRDFLFGYEDPALMVAHQIEPTFDSRFPGFFNNFSSPDAATEKLRDKNRFSMMTGLNHRDKIRSFTSWRESGMSMKACMLAPCPPNDFVDAWETDEANAVRGSDGSIFPAPLDKSRKYPVMMGNIYRAVDLEYDGESVHKDIKVWRYKVPASSWLNSTSNPANKAFHQHSYDGLYNISKISNTIPFFPSKPHFVDGDPRLREQAPVAYKVPHQPFDTQFFVEPTSGISLFADSYSQLNVMLEPLEGMPIVDSEEVATWFPNVKRGAVAPLFWAQQSAGISDKDAKEFYDNVYGALFLADTAYYGGDVIGALLLLAGVVLTGIAFYQHRTLRGGEHSTLIGTPVSPDEAAAFGIDKESVDLTYHDDDSSTYQASASQKPAEPVR